MPSIHRNSWRNARQIARLFPSFIMLMATMPSAIAANLDDGLMHGQIGEDLGKDDCVPIAHWVELADVARRKKNVVAAVWCIVIVPRDRVTA